MRKIDKDFSDIPESLVPDYPDLFKDNKVPITAKTTHKKRLEIIANNAYISDDSYNDRYKLEKIQTQLKELYRNKCAFCEQKVEQSHIEHYRPKNGTPSYHWLAYSWDNLLIACPKCNEYKGVKFEIDGSYATFVNDEFNLRNINNLSHGYDAIEKPRMVNPEVTDPEQYITFTREGNIDSQNDRFIYTINSCKLNRTYLKDERRKVYDEFEKRLKSKVLKYRYDKNILSTHLQEITSDFIEEANNIDNQFLGFRKYAILNKWIKNSIKGIVGS